MDTNRPPAVSALSLGRRCQILLAVAAADYEAAANLITNSPFLDWRALVPADHHAALAAYLGGTR